jgi:Bacterial Ig domain
VAPSSRTEYDIDDDDEVEADHRFEPRPLDEGSPARIIATMVGIVGILLLGSLFWSALGALLGAFGAASQAVPTARPAPVLVVTVVPSTLAAATSAPTLQSSMATLVSGTATPVPTAESTPQPTATPLAQAEGRAPWILLPQPAPGTRVTPGPVTVEARGRGDSAITNIRLELDGAALQSTLEQRGESTWRGFASARVGAGQHTVKAVVVDEKGKSGSYRWSFDAGP